MDARKVHELIHGQHKQNAGGTAPINQNIDFKNQANSLNQDPRPVKPIIKIDGIKWGRMALGIGALAAVAYLLIRTPKNNTSSNFFQRRKLREKDSLDNDLG